jgi:[ribosomal protein S5]-alanine N-acetyltransferase
MYVPNIDTKKCQLRPFSLDDISDLVWHINDEEIARNELTIPYPYTRAHAQAFLERILEPSHPAYYFAIALNEEVIGSVALTHVHAGEADVSYWLSKQYWNKGITSCALDAVVKYGFHIGLDRINAKVISTNTASMRVLEKAGFMQTALLKNHDCHGHILDCYAYTKSQKAA